MDTAALYIGYIVIGLLAIALIGFILLTLLGTVLGLYRIIKYKRTICLLTKYEEKNMYKACKVAAQFLLSKGLSQEDTLQDVMNMIENYRRHCRIKED